MANTHLSRYPHQYDSYQDYRVRSFPIIMPRSNSAEELSDDARLTSVWHLSVAYIGPKSRTETPRKTKIGIEVGHVTRDSDTAFKVKRSRVNLQGAGHIVAASRTACYWRFALYHSLLVYQCIICNVCLCCLRFLENNNWRHGVNLRLRHPVFWATAADTYNGTYRYILVVSTPQF